ncbi:hypothetical protein PT974_10273 [Cladobotryum mycophilum]|uniref:Uncharacterized protein n=1 Tax=Cladobotryum mycophilum TaxID=491253 RepID=A0ABR0S9J8_9HYPO
MAALHEQLLAKDVDINPQSDSPLFKLFPPEIRSKIFQYTLTDYEDTSSQSKYEESTCYTRPSYFARRRTSAELVQTCRAVYRETWFLPVILREQVIWLAQSDRQPPFYNQVRDLQKYTTQISQWNGQEFLAQDENGHGEGKTTSASPSDQRVEIESMQVFAQMYKLEEGGLARIMKMKHWYARKITLTIRHTDWWYWEDDELLSFEGSWLKGVNAQMSSSTREFRIELESLERKKDQVDMIAKQMSQRWFFKRPDGVVLYPDASEASKEVSRWQGTSIWHQKRWIRDETEQGKLEYYIRTITFLPEHVLLARGGTVSEKAREMVSAKTFDKSWYKLQATGEKLEVEVPCIIDPPPRVTRQSGPQQHRHGYRVTHE